MTYDLIKCGNVEVSSYYYNLLSTIHEYTTSHAKNITY